MNFHLGCGFERDEHGVLCMNPIKFIEKMEASYEQMFGCKPTTRFHSPLAENDHPELDSSSFLGDTDIQKYQSMVGSLQWVIAIGRFDVQTAVMTLSSFRVQPREGHLNRAKRIYGYISKFRHFKIRFRVGIPDFVLTEGNSTDWSNTVYGEHSEDLPSDAPKPLGKVVVLSHFYDANLMHDILSGKAVTGILHFANKTPIMWFSKKQATSETATFGAEFVSARTCIEQIVDIRQSFRYLGTRVHDTSYTWGDNEKMIQTSTFPYARLHKRHHILSYHYVRSMIARGFILMQHLAGKDNCADILTKHWGHSVVYPLLKPIFYYCGNTGDLLQDDCTRY